MANGDTQSQPTNIVDQQAILKALMAQMAAQRGQGSLSGIPGAMPSAPQTQAPSQAPAQPQTGGMPGAAPQAQPQGGAARQLSPASPTPFNGTFGDRRGIISQIVNSAEKKSHDKKVNEAEMYYNQINSFLASGNPQDAQKAQSLLDDPKVRKILKTGLDYVPLEEEVPPEAIGIHQAQQKIDKKQSAIQQIQQMLRGGQKQGSAQPRPPGKAIIPQASQASQQAYDLAQSKIGTEQALGQKDLAEAQKAEADRLKAEADAVQAKAYADNARSQAKLYDKQADEVGDMNPSKKREAEAHSNEMNAMARYHDAMSKYVKNKDGKIPGSALQSQIKSARSDMVSLLKGYMSDNKDAAKAVTKDTGYVFGPKSALVKAQDDAAKKSKDMSRAISWFDGEGTDAITNGKMTLPDAVRKAYQMAGIEPPPSGISGDQPTSTDDEIMKLIGQ